MTHDELAACESIRELLARYNHAGDRGDLAGLAACFADDGLLWLPDDTRLVGRDAIARALAAVGIAGDDPPRLRHHVSSVWIRLDGDHAADVRAYYAVLTASGLDHWGQYRDRVVRQPSGWRFASRRVLLDGHAPDSRVVRPD